MKKIFLMMIMGFFILTGCTQNDNKTYLEIEMLEEEIIIKDGGSITIASIAPLSLNPLLNMDPSVDNMLRLIFEPLAILDENLKPVPNLAKSFELSYTDNSILVTMRDDVFWTNGSKVTAYDVVFSIDTIRNASNSIYKEQINNIVSTNVIDEQNIRIHFRNGSTISKYSLLFPIIPASHYRGNLNASVPVGNGPFMMYEYRQNREITLVKNPNYFKGAPNIQTIRVIMVQDNQTKYYAFQENIIDALPTSLSSFNRHSGSRDSLVNTYATGVFDFIGFNLSNNYLRDRRVRQAIAHSVDIEEIMRNVYLGQGERALTPINPASWLYESDVLYHEHNIETAIALLNQSSMSEHSRENTVFRILVNEENIERVSVANILQRRLLDIGIQSEIAAVSFLQYTDMLNRGEFDIFIGGVNLSHTPDLTSMFGTNGNINFSSYSNEVMDVQLRAVLNSSTEEELKRNVSNVQKTIANDIPIVGLAFRKSALVTGKNIYGAVEPSANNVFMGIHNWHIVK
jgi:peptide/nickel transport system substrate-binding protein